MLNRTFLFIFIPFLIYSFLSTNISILIFTEVIIVFSLFELYEMFKRKSIAVYDYYGILVGFLIPIFVYYRKNPVLLLIFSALILAVLQISTNKIEKAIEKLSFTFFGILYIAFSFTYTIKIKQLENGGALLLFVFCLIWVCDTFAYIFGMTLGKHKFSRISPNKSIEGLLGGFLGTLLLCFSYEHILYYASILISKIINTPVLKVKIFDSKYEMIIFAFIVTALAVLGDLFESKLKREFGIKDSGKILLGHGGFLDRFDSALFVLPFAFYIFKLFVN
ncbi:phosphatidate cytidylyltransferase [Caviibacter abscessus]|uniref:phosphatidate cytidylyltransferase n=1 Tax=Caviibacter abscessus TaxID=1766719 RepID=UPI00082CE327|nr:phosphatidate cytidylyltransferase [Caviibacter abscessus]